MSTSPVKTNKKRLWTHEEDTLLLQLTELHGTVGNWHDIAEEMESRSAKQCRERYVNQLDPSIKKTEWTIEEDSTIKRLYFEIGKKWSRYMEHLPGRSDNAIKNRYHVISRDNFAEHNLQRAAALGVGDGASATAPTAGSSAQDTAAVRLDRFRCARDALDRQIRALERERDLLIEQALKDDVALSELKASEPLEHQDTEREECGLRASRVEATTNGHATGEGDSLELHFDCGDV